MKRFQIIIPIALCMAAFVSILMKRAQTRTNELIQETETGVQTWKKEEALKQVEDAERNFNEATRLLAAKDPTGSYLAYHRAVGDVSHYVENYPDNEIKDGLTLKQWLDRRDQPYRKAVAENFPDVLKALETGAIPAGEARQLKNYYKQAGFDEIVRQYQSAEPDIVAARARFASTRLYVHISESSHGYPDLLRALIADRWNEEMEFQPIYGGTLGQAERSAAWKQLNIQVSQQNARYEVQGSERDKWRISPPQIPERVEIQFRMSGSSEIPTSWDKLPPFKASVEVPKSLWLKPEFRNGGAEVETSIRKAQEDVLSAIRKELARLPKFQLFPDVDLSSAVLQTDKGLDLKVARAIYFSDKKRLLAELAALANSGDSNVVGDLPLIAVTLNLESMAETVTKVLPTIDRRKRSPAFRALAKNPGYGDYEPLLAHVRNPPADEDAGRAIDALRGHARPPRDQGALSSRRSPTRNTRRRSRFSHALIEGLSRDELAQFAPAWIQDRRPRLRRARFSTRSTARDLPIGRPAPARAFRQSAPLHSVPHAVLLPISTPLVHEHPIVDAAQEGVDPASGIQIHPEVRLRQALSRGADENPAGTRSTSWPASRRTKTRSAPSKPGSWTECAQSIPKKPVNSC